jgi:ABC-type branched-subunit amino acid transport system substrate-binding protein
MDMPAGKDCEVAAKNACKQAGLQYVGSEWLPYGGTDYSTQVLTLKDRKPDIVVFIHIGISFEAFVRDAYRLGLTKSTQLFAHFYINCPYIVNATGYEPWRGVHGYNNWALINEDTDGMRALKGMVKKYKPDWGSIDTLHERLVGFFVARDWSKIVTLSEGYRIAMDKVGYEKMNGEALRDGLENLKGYTANGLCPPITFGRDRRIGCIEKQFRVVEVVENKNYTRAISDWLGLDRNLTPEEKTPEFWTAK